MSYFSNVIIIISALTLAAQDINLTGTVANSLYSTPLNNVVVTLVNRPQFIDTTGLDGTYHLAATGVIHGLQGKASQFGNRLSGGVLEIDVTKRGPVTIEAYGLSGALKARLVNDVLAPGLYKYDMHASFSAADMFLIKIRKGDNTTVFPFLSLRSSFTNNMTADRSSGRLSKSEGFDDTLVFSAGGYTTVKKAVTSSTGQNDVVLDPLPGTVTDIDGNVYHTITITGLLYVGTQEWMVENLRTTRYSDGTPIALVNDSTAWSQLKKPGYCWYNNDSAANRKTYGALYNWYAVNTGIVSNAKLAPRGWHVSSDGEWSSLITYLGGDNAAGGKMKETDTTHWNSPNVGATNGIGFSALPGGSRDGNGSFNFIGTNGYWWTSTQYDSASAWLRAINNGNPDIYSIIYGSKDGFSVRCVRG